MQKVVISDGFEFYDVQQHPWRGLDDWKKWKKKRKKRSVDSWERNSSSSRWNSDLQPSWSCWEGIEPSWCVEYKMILLLYGSCSSASTAAIRSDGTSWNFRSSARFPRPNYARRRITSGYLDDGRDELVTILSKEPRIVQKSSGTLKKKKKKKKNFYPEKNCNSISETI